MSRPASGRRWRAPVPRALVRRWRALVPRALVRRWPIVRARLRQRLVLWLPLGAMRVARPLELRARWGRRGPRFAAARSRSGTAAARARQPAAVDVRVTNPMGLPAGRGGLVAVVDTGEGADLGAARVLLEAVAASLPVTAITGRAAEGDHVLGAPVARRPASTRRLVLACRERVGIIDHPSFHADPASRAELLVRLAASGAPVAAIELAVETAALLGDELASVLVATAPADLLDPYLRELASIRQRRIALTMQAGHGAPAPPAPPTVSVLLATNRTEHLAHAASQLARQVGVTAEVVLALHGPERFAPDLVREASEQLAVPVRVVEVPAALNLGEVLSEATRHAEGELVTKWDDDDWYGPNHLRDLCLALAYSGAEIVGKGAEYAYLAEPDLTLRRFAGGAERFSATIAGATLCARREHVLALDGWPAAPRRVDQLLVERFLAAGGRPYRTHGHEFMFRRATGGRPPTWPIGADDLVRQATLQRPGLDLDLAGVG